jgi:hypothetical protein
LADLQVDREVSVAIVVGDEYGFYFLDGMPAGVMVTVTMVTKSAVYEVPITSSNVTRVCLLRVAGVSHWEQGRYWQV